MRPLNVSVHHQQHMDASSPSIASFSSSLCFNTLGNNLLLRFFLSHPLVLLFGFLLRFDLALHDKHGRGHTSTNRSRPVPGIPFCDVTVPSNELPETFTQHPLSDVPLRER